MTNHHNKLMKPVVQKVCRFLSCKQTLNLPKTTYNFNKEGEKHTKRNPQCSKKFTLFHSIIKKSLHKKI